MTKANRVTKIEEMGHGGTPRLLVLFDPGQEDIVKIVADVLGQACCIVTSLNDALGRSDGVVVGLGTHWIHEAELVSRTGMTTIATHAIDIQDHRDESLTNYCDYEYLYTRAQFSRRDLSRFLGFVLGQVKPHDVLTKKARSFLLSTTFPDIRGALPNMDILSVGADSIELRVDLLKEPSVNGFDAVNGGMPSLRYVGEQVMLLRQRTELPIVFTTRCTRENGRFPMDDPGLFYRYLRKAIQWGCEYIDVELWLPEEIRHRLSAEKGNTKIIASVHDYSGHFSWSSSEALRTFSAAADYGDVVKMIALIHDTNKNYELEQFRLMVHSEYPDLPLAALNMGHIGQLSRSLNRAFTPITHPLLPTIAVPGQLSAAETNSRLYTMGELQKAEVYAIGSTTRNGQALFLEKCLNELSLPHQLRSLETTTPETITQAIQQNKFGGAYLNPPVPAGMPCLPATTEAAAAIGQTDTIAVRHDDHRKTLICDNATWKGIRSTLNRDFTPSAFAGRPALVLATHESQVAAAIYALATLHVGAIYTVGFKTQGALSSRVHQFRGVEDMKKVDDPFVIISALPPTKSLVLSSLLKHYNGTSRRLQRSGRVFLDLTTGNRGKGDSVHVAASLGYRSYGIATVNAAAMVETLRSLLGVDVGSGFVTLASGRSLFS